MTRPSLIRIGLVFVSGMLLSVSTGCGTVDPGTEDGAGVLDYDLFKTAVQPVLDLRGCSQGGCHYRDKSNPSSGGPGGSFRVFDCANDSCSDDELRADYDSATGMSDPANPAGSKLLRKPLSEGAGGIQHLGGDIFSDATDSDYLSLLGWIQSPL